VPTDTAPILLPDPDQGRARIAELAREQTMLRRLLRVLVRGQQRPVPRDECQFAEGVRRG
jgi:hypothetical protein